MLLVLILLGACAYLWADNRKLLELRIADAMRSTREKADEIKSKDAQVLALTNEIEGLEQQLLLLNQVNEELERRVREADDELRRRTAELENMREAESDMKAFYSTVVATKDKELAVLQAGLGREIQRILKDKDEIEAARDELEQKNLELRDRVSEYHRRVNDGNYADEALKQSPFLFDSSALHQGHRRHGAIGGVRESERETSHVQPETKFWGGYTVPHGMGL